MKQCRSTKKKVSNAYNWMLWAWLSLAPTVSAFVFSFRFFFLLLHILEYGTGPFQRFMMRKMFCTTEMLVENARICCYLVVVRAAASAFCRILCTFFFSSFLNASYFFSVHRVCMVKEPEDKRPKLIVFIRILFQFFLAVVVVRFSFFLLLLQFIFHSSAQMYLFHGNNSFWMAFNPGELFIWLLNA